MLLKLALCTRFACELSEDYLVYCLKFKKKVCIASYRKHYLPLSWNIVVCTPVASFLITGGGTLYLRFQRLKVPCSGCLGETSVFLSRVS